MLKNRNNDKLSPGREAFLESEHQQDIEPGMFRELVTRRSRINFPASDIVLPKLEEPRRELEMSLEKVHLDRDFLPVSFLIDGAERSLSVCKINVSLPHESGSGTGFLITPTLILTNWHVLKTPEWALNSMAEFRYEEGQNPIVVSFDPDRFFITNSSLDYTIVACSGYGIEEIPTIPLLRNPAVITRNERVNIIQHPRGRKKEVSLHDNKVDRIMSSVIHYTTDTEPGSSGSPVFNNQWDLVALHHAGEELGGGKAINEGVRIAAIVNDLLRRLQNRESSIDDPVVKDLLGGISDSSPLLGFFGSEGLGLSDYEVQVNGFTGTPDFADVGCWNIEHFNNNVSNQRVSDVADVVYKLSLDALGLSEVQEGAMKKLVESLNTRGSRYDFVFRDTNGSQDLAVLYDTDTTNVIRRKDIADRNLSALRVRTKDNKTAFPRFPLFAECDVHYQGSSVKFIMIVVHLKAFGDAQSRARRRLAAEKLSEIIDDIRSVDKLPVVLCGDFNEKLDNNVLSAIKDTPDLFPLTADDATDGAISYVGQRHRSLIDHIIVSRDINLGKIAGDDAAYVRLDKSVSDFSSRISDHIPLVLRMIIRDNPIDVDLNYRGDDIVVDIPDGKNKLSINFD